MRQQRNPGDVSPWITLRKASQKMPRSIIGLRFLTQFKSGYGRMFRRQKRAEEPSVFSFSEWDSILISAFIPYLTTKRTTVR